MEVITKEKAIKLTETILDKALNKRKLEERERRYLIQLLIYTLEDMKK